MQYLRKIKYKGNPNPKNCNYFELLHKGISVFIIGFRQHGQNMLAVFPASRLYTIPGLVALACSAAKVQSGGIMSRSIIEIVASKSNQI